MEKDEVKQDVDLENNEEVTQDNEKEVKEEPKEDYRAKLNAQNRFLEKEGYKFENGKWIKPQTETKGAKQDTVREVEGLSTKDLYHLVKANVPEEDLGEVTEYAKLKNISIPEALNSNIVKAILKDKSETRKTAEATQTRSTRQTSKADGSAIIANIKSGGESAIPEPGSEEAEALFMERNKRRSA